MKTITPTFLIPGAGKSGTSFLADALRRHPDIFIPEIKEPSFLSTWPGYGRYGLGEGYYQKHFAAYAGQREIGEASTVYMFDPASPGLIKKHLGAPKLVFILRHPVDRVYSNYWQETKHGRSLPPFKEFLAERGARAREMIYVSQYGEHLKNYLEVFDRANMLVLLYEELRADPAALFKKVTDFLDLPPLPQTPDGGRRVNPPSRARFGRLNLLINSRRANELIRGVIPTSWIGPLKRARDRTNKLLQKPFSYPPMDAESRAALLEELSAAPDFLEQEFGLELTGWRR